MIKGDTLFYIWFQVHKHTQKNSSVKTVNLYEHERFQSSFSTVKRIKTRMRMHGTFKLKSYLNK